MKAGVASTRSPPSPISTPPRRRSPSSPPCASATTKGEDSRRSRWAICARSSRVCAPREPCSPRRSSCSWPRCSPRCARRRTCSAPRARRGPDLAALGDPLTPYPHLERALEATFDPSGEIKDSASSDLRRIRRDRETRRERLRARMERLATKIVDQDAATLVTLREGRYVLAVPQSHKARTPGIVQDRSASGQTFFIEPMEIVEDNNGLRETGRRGARGDSPSSRRSHQTVLSGTRDAGGRRGSHRGAGHAARTRAARAALGRRAAGADRGSPTAIEGRASSAASGGAPHRRRSRRRAHRGGAARGFARRDDARAPVDRPQHGRKDGGA